MTREHIHEWFSRVAGECGDRPAIDGGAAPVDYRALEAAANRQAHFLLSAGLAKGTPVAILADDVVEIVTSILAVLKAGGVFVPLDPRMPERRLRAMIAEVAAGWFVTEAKYIALVGAIAGGPVRVLCVGGAPGLATRDGIELLAGYDGFDALGPPAVVRDPDEPCYVYFTSGSTGQPKGITGRLKAIDHYIRWEITTFGIGSGDRVSQLTTPSFDASLRDFFAPLAAGGTVCVPPPGTVVDAQKLVDWIDAERITVVHCVPSVFRLMLSEVVDNRRFAALRYVLMAGEAIAPADAARWYELFGTRIELINLYGPSETTMTKFFHRITPDDARRRLMPIGKPMAGAAALVVDEQGHPCPVGVVGEILIRTPYRTLGYFGRDDLTKAVFIPNPFGTDPNDLVYKTGDLGRRLQDGTFELIGRRDHQVKIRGERVELGAIETVLRSHPAVADAVVVDREDSTATRYLAAYLVMRGSADTAALRDALARDLPQSMVPSMMIVMEALPRLINGKIDRAALPAPEESARGDRRFEGPRTPVEERLSALFSDVLGVSRIGIHESFFELGGHSLLATQLVSRVRSAFNVQLAVRALFDSPTIAGIAEHVDALVWAASPAAASAARTEIEL